MVQLLRFHPSALNPVFDAVSEGRRCRSDRSRTSEAGGVRVREGHEGTRVGLLRARHERRRNGRGGHWTRSRRQIPVLAHGLDRVTHKIIRHFVD